MSLRKFAELADIELTDESVTTLGGLVMNNLGRIPIKGDRVDIGSLSIVVTEVKRRRVVTVTVKKNPD
jgi:CBS domain containing-hemolysin-like protein